MSDADICAAFERLEKSRGETSLTYFEFTTLAALILFDERPLDVLILEVGLGGRLDAVNIVDADLSIITSIDLDHQDWLGDNREAIGYEKAGVLRPGGRLVYGEAEMPQSVLQHAVELGCRLLRRGEEFDLEQHEDSWDWRGRGTDNQALRLAALPQPAILVENAATAIQALFAAGFDLDKAQLIEALEKVAMCGRQQRLFVNDVEVIVDVSHNPAAVNKLAATLGKRGLPTWAVMAAMADKDIDGLIGALAPVVEHWVFADICGIDRAATAEQLQQSAKHLGVTNSAVATSPSFALRSLIGREDKPKQLVVFGSFHTVADVLQSGLLNVEFGGFE